MNEKDKSIGSHLDSFLEKAKNSEGWLRSEYEKAQKMLETQTEEKQKINRQNTLLFYNVSAYCCAIFFFICAAALYSEPLVSFIFFVIGLVCTPVFTRWLMRVSGRTWPGWLHPIAAFILFFIAVFSFSATNPVTETTPSTVEAPVAVSKSATYLSNEAQLLKRNQAFSKLPDPYNRIAMSKKQLEQELAPLGSKVSWSNDSNEYVEGYNVTVDHGSGFVETYELFSFLENGIPIEPVHVGVISSTYGLPCDYSDDIRPLMKRMENFLGVVQPIKAAGYTLSLNNSSAPKAMQHFDITAKGFDGQVGLKYSCKEGQVVQSVSF